MRALQLVDAGKLELREVPVPRPGPGEVLVKVAGAGLCHSDLHLVHAGVKPPVPFTIGHETSGWVESTGPGVDGLEPGLPVIVHGAWGCGHCWFCAIGHEQQCPAAAASGAPGSGLFRDGGLAEYLLVPAARHLVPLGDLDPCLAAPLDDAALTPYHVIKTGLADLVPGETAVVIGVGGLGHAAIQLLRTLTAVKVVAVDVSAEKRALAISLGADEALEGDAGAVREAVGGHGAVLVLDCVGVDATLALSAAVVRRMGRIVIIGVGGGSIDLSFLSLPYEASIANTFWGTVAELREVVALAASGRIALHTERIKLDEALEAYEQIDRGTFGSGRAVAAPGD